jgi:2-hydroxy-6-oxonona-2,4-dienedioate hydrolase
MVSLEGGRASRRWVLGAAGAAVLAGFAYGAGSFRATLAGSRHRIASRSSLAPTRFGQMEYATAGIGKPMLMLHGTGGGFDQGLRFGADLAANGFAIIAPSRFGYLRSDFPPEPSPEHQADALVDLLDHLKIDRIPAIGGSAGALPAIQFALRHSDRCSALILLVPAANLTGKDPVPFTAFQKFLVEQLLFSDFWFWLASRLAAKQTFSLLLGTDSELLDSVSAGEQQRAELILDDILPPSARARGMLNDMQMAGNPSSVALESLRLPLLIISAEDDRFGTAETARTIASRVAGARLIIFPSGGHIWLGHARDVTKAIAAFVV